MTHAQADIQPELWVSDGPAAIAFYEWAFGAVVEHRVVGPEAADVIAQLSVAGARFWVSTASESLHRFSPDAIGGATGRVLLVVDAPDAVVAAAVAAGATETSPIGEEHGWRLGRIVDPFGHEWEVGRPLGPWPPGSVGTPALRVLDHGEPIALSFADLMAYHGPGSPGGVAHAYKVLERALPLLDPDGPPERREIAVRTAFGGPGARDAFEVVTRAVTGERYVVDPALARPERGRTLERFVFALAYRDRAVTLILRDGFVTDEFIDLARKEDPTPEDDERLARLKLEMADRVMSAAAADVYDVV